MASVLSRLSILLHADTAQFRRDMRDTQTRLGRFGVGAKQAMKVAAVGIAAGAGVAAAAIGGIAKEQMAAAAEFERFAQLSNTTAVEFQKLAAGAARYGIEADKLSDIYKDMNDRVGDFVQTGGGPLADFFENIAPKVGVTAESFKNLSGPESLQLFYNSLEKANLSQADMVFYMESIASDSTALQPLLANNGQGFKELGDQAQKAGAIMGQDTLDSTKRLNQDLASLKTSFQGVKVQIYEAVLPALIQAADWFKANQDEIKSFINGIVSVVKVMAPVVKGAFTVVYNAGVFLGEGIAKLVIGFQNAKQKIVDTATGIKNAFVNLPSQMATIGRDIINGLINGIKERKDAAVNLVKDTASSMYQGVKDFFVVRSPSRLMRTLGNDVIEGLVVGVKDKKSEAFRAAVDVAKSLISGMETVRKEIALFGNDSAVAAFDYENMIGNYDHVAPELREKYRADLLKLENMKKEERARAAFNTSLSDRASQFQDDQKSASDAFGGLEINQPQTEAEKLQAAYENKMAIVDKYEQMHTDKKAQAEGARQTLTENYNQSIKDLEMQKQAQTVGSVAAMFGMALGETSRGYKAMFAIQKAYDFVAAQSASFTAIAKAWSSAPFPANIPAVATTTLQTGIIPAAIQALAPKGYKQGGYTGSGGVDDVAGLVHGREFVAHADATRKYRPELEAMNKGTYQKGSNPVINMTIENHTDATVRQERDPDGRIRLIVGEEVKRQAFNNRSDLHRGLNANYNMRRNLA